MAVYYNEIEPYAAEWLRNLMKEGLIPDGEVDTRSIIDVRPDDLRGFAQAHFFAGIGGWPHALRLAGWPDDRSIWTGSCPCQPFSVAGKGKGTADERHLWPVFFDLIRACRPPVVMGEQVAGAAGYGWFDGVSADLEGEGYAAGAFDLAACAVGAPHLRQRIYWVAMADAAESEWRRGASNGRCIDDRAHAGRPQDQRHLARGGEDCFNMGNAKSLRFRGDTGKFLETQQSHCGERGERRERPSIGGSSDGGFWSDAELFVGADGKTRRVKPGLQLLVDGVPNRVGRLRALGNAIVPPLAAEVIGALMEALDAT